jgi:hypothetical protein
MFRTVLVVVAMAIGVATLTPALQACGDKFLMVGRGAKFQRVYASINPGRVLIYARPATNNKAAIRDPQLHKALRQAGHSVSVIEDWELLEQALKTVPVDVILVDVKEADRIRSVVSKAASHPEALYVAGPSGVPPDMICKLKETDRAVRFLDEVENVMKARTRRSKG